MSAPTPSRQTPVDPITLEVIRQGIISICDQIDANMARMAFSPYVYEYKDYAVGFVSAAGELLAQSTGRGGGYGPPGERPRELNNVCGIRKAHIMNGRK